MNESSDTDQGGGIHMSRRGVGWLKEGCGVATISRLLKILGLFCRIQSF